jgi:hypothetical protein
MKHDPRESIAAQWLSWEDALAAVDELPLRRMLEKARRTCQSAPLETRGKSTRKTVNPGEH